MNYTKRDDLQPRIASHERALQHENGVLAVIAAEECDMEALGAAATHIGFTFQAREIDVNAQPTGTMTERYTLTVPRTALRDGYRTVADILRDGNEQGLRRIVDEKVLEAQLASLTVKRVDHTKKPDVDPPAPPTPPVRVVPSP